MFLLTTNYAEICNNEVLISYHHVSTAKTLLFLYNSHASSTLSSDRYRGQH
ncbi:hypothetical protein Fmac_032141 [Flemingia macrophylla]|uniref:Uncharacterized protein n=1 Tax=Flemingia macrophylla TaxID=520843 RepID=A0ABD1L432_9FABA